MSKFSSLPSSFSSSSSIDGCELRADVGAGKGTVTRTGTGTSTGTATGTGARAHSLSRSFSLSLFRIATEAPPVAPSPRYDPPPNSQPLSYRKRTKTRTTTRANSEYRTAKNGEQRPRITLLEYITPSLYTYDRETSSTPLFLRHGYGSMAPRVTRKRVGERERGGGARVTPRRKNLANFPRRLFFLSEMVGFNFKLASRTHHKSRHKHPERYRSYFPMERFHTLFPLIAISLFPCSSTRRPFSSCQ